MTLPRFLFLLTTLLAGCGPGGGTASPAPGLPGAGAGAGASQASREYAKAPPFNCMFVDISRGTGITFRHETGGYGAKLLPEAMGAGGAFLDFDGDRVLDLFLVNGRPLRRGRPPTSPAPTCALYRGNGDATFQDVTAATGAGITLYGMGACAGDYDGDGDDDLFVTGLDRSVLLRNDGGVFHDATAAAGLSTEGWCTSAGWADIDLDGDVDLVVGSFVRWIPEDEIFTTLDGVTKAFATPDAYPGLPCRLLLNQGDGTFQDATQTSGLGGCEAKALGMAFWDFDDDGLVDIVVANDTRPNFFFRNRGGAVFEETALRAAIAYDETGRAGASMGVDIADYMNDGVPGVVLGAFSEEPISLYRWQEDGRFSSEAGRAGIAQPTYPRLAFGVLFLDVDLDGVQDLLVANGHIEPDIGRVFENESYAQSPQLFHGRAYGKFEDVSTRAGLDFLVPRVARGLLAGDIDGDGDLDVIFTTCGGNPVVLQNMRSARDPNHFLRVRVHGQGKNTHALGSVVRLTTGDVTQTRLVRTGSSYLSQSEMTLTFGLRAWQRVDRLEVRWPDGKVTRPRVQAVDRTIDVYP